MNNYKNVTRFIVTALGLCLSWFILYDFWLSSFDEWLTFKVVKATVYMLSMLGYNAEAKNIMVQIDGQDTVFVYHACNGMVLMALFTGFIIAFPGPILKKLVYIPVGLFVINLLNVSRVAALALNAHHFNQTVNFNHKYTFTIIVYAAIFGLWMLWVRRYSGLNNHVNTSKLEAQAT